MPDCVRLCETLTEKGRSLLVGLVSQKVLFHMCVCVFVCAPWEVLIMPDDGRKCGPIESYHSRVRVWLHVGINQRSHVTVINEQRTASSFARSGKSDSCLRSSGRFDILHLSRHSKEP